MTFKKRIQSGCAILGQRTNFARLLYGVVLLSLWCLSRWPWLDCDGGTPSLWEFGSFVTDEGYYLGGAKEKYCFGFFVELLRGEACTFGFSPLTHLLCWASYLIFGLKAWATRVPFFLISMLAYGSLFWFLARRTLPLLAFAACCCVMFTPLMVVYERTASNDVLIAAFFVMAYVAACGRSVPRALLAGSLCAAIAWVKPSAYVLLPLVVCGMLSVRKTKSRLVDLGCFLAAFFAVVALEKIALFAILRPDAVLNGVTASEVVRQTTSHYGMPNLLDFERVFCGLVSFPRYPANTALAVWAVLLTLLPLTVLCWRLAGGRGRFRLDRRLILYVMVPAYCFAVAIMNTHYAHYFIPVILFSPILWLEMRRDLRGGQRGAWWPVFSIAVVALVSGVCLKATGYTREAILDAQYYAARTMNLPQSAPWLFNWKPMLVWGVIIAGVGVSGLWYRLVARANGARVPLLGGALQSLGLAACVVLALSISYSQLPLAIVAPFSKYPQESLLMNMRVVLVAAVMIALSVWILPRAISRGIVWHTGMLAVFAAAFVICPVWRNAAGELTVRSHLMAEGTKKLLAALPPDALVIGERAPQLLLASPVKACSTIPFNDNPIPVIEAVTKARPGTPLVAVIDTQFTYNLEHYQRNADKVTLRLYEKLRLPSVSTGKPVDVYLGQLSVIGAGRAGEGTATAAPSPARVSDGQSR